MNREKLQKIIASATGWLDTSVCTNRLTDNILTLESQGDCESLNKKPLRKIAKTKNHSVKFLGECLIDSEMDIWKHVIFIIDEGIRTSKSFYGETFPCVESQVRQYLENLPDRGELK